MSISVFEKFPNCLVMGIGAAETICDQVKRFGDITKVAVITDEGLKDLPIVTNLLTILKNGDYDTCIISGVRSLPTDANVLDAVENVQQFGAEIIIAIGGGSAIDCARAVNALYSYGGTLEDHNISKQKYIYSKSKLKPFIAISTTAGTGSEVAAGCGIIKTDPNTGEGIGFYIISAPTLIPDVSIIDPLMSLSMSPDLTAATGMDALTHAYESMVSTNNFPISTALSLEALHMIFSNLRTAVSDGRNIEARDAMAIAATTATMAFQQSGLGLVHAISEGLSAFALIPHGVANAILLPPVMFFNAPCTQGKLARIVSAMGVDATHFDGELIEKVAIYKVLSLMKDINIADSFTKYLTARELSQPHIFKPISRDIVEKSASLAMNTSFIRNNPRDVSKSDVDAILELLFTDYIFS